MAKSKNVSKRAGPGKPGKRREAYGPGNPPERETIARRAYEIWKEQGCPAGRDEENWYQAERELEGGR